VGTEKLLVAPDVLFSDPVPGLNVICWAPAPAVSATVETSVAVIFDIRMEESCFVMLDIMGKSSLLDAEQTAPKIIFLTKAIK